jgi:hypothetical protein
MLVDNHPKKKLIPKVIFEHTNLHYNGRRNLLNLLYKHTYTSDKDVPLDINLMSQMIIRCDFTVNC